jgi:peptidoglycan hydrolase-like protein with peptidoglycan-binding domain
MRFKEFKTLLREAGEGSFYTIGDSHAVAVATAGGQGWTNLAIGGRSSTDSAMLANIAKIPKGATVLVSQGANDTANAMKAAEQSKQPPKDPKAIAANVANVVNKVQAQGATVIFMLFPNGPGRGAGLAKYYGGDYQEQVRNAIKSAIGSVQVIDINGKQLTDGVHATMGVYKEVANQVKATQAPAKKLGTDNAAPGAVRAKDKAPSAELKKGPPFPAEDREAVRAMQKELEAAGYDTGPTGQDGKFGPYTAAALAAFKKDYNVQGDGQTFDQLAQDTLSKVQSGAIARVEQPTPTNGVAFKGDAKGGVGETGTAKEAVAFFVSKGWTPQQAAGIVGNLQAESGANLRTDAVGDGGKAYGIAQWHPDRQAKFATAFGKDIRQAGFKEQLEFVQWELENSESKAAAKLKGAVTAEQAAWLFDQYYERSSGAHRQKRIDNALALAPKQTSPTLA